MSVDRLVVVGASSGGIEALGALNAALPPDFAAPICIVSHTAPESPPVLDQILTRAGNLPASMARTGDRLRPGHLYVAPPDHHLLIEPGAVCLSRGPRENRFRPAIDPLFRSAAQVYGPRAIGVVLTGNLDDGAAGLWAIRRLGGVAVVQDPATALVPSMPANALRRVPDAHVVPIDELAAFLQQVLATSVYDGPLVPLPHVEVEMRIANDQPPLPAGLLSIASPSTYTCPECHGALLALKEDEQVRYRCHTGHAYSPESLLADLAESIEHALGSAERALQEAALLMRQIGTDLDSDVDRDLIAHLRAEADRATSQAQVVRGVLSDRPALGVLRRA